VSFDIDESRVGDRVVVTVSGDVDVVTAPRLRQRLLDLVESGQTDLMVDLRPTEFIDSSGLSSLVAAAKRARERGGDVGLVCPPSNVRRLLEIAALDRMLQVVDTL
jgi:anti-sigma B factor antagonist